MVIVWAVDMPPGSNKNRSAVWATVKMLSCLPIRLNAVHICYDNILLKALITLGSYAADTFTRVRMRSHYGKTIWLQMILRPMSNLLIFQPFPSRFLL